MIHTVLPTVLYCCYVIGCRRRRRQYAYAIYVVATDSTPYNTYSLGRRKRGKTKKTEKARKKDQERTGKKEQEKRTKRTFQLTFISN